MNYSYMYTYIYLLILICFTTYLSIKTRLEQKTDKMNMGAFTFICRYKPFSIFFEESEPTPIPSAVALLSLLEEPPSPLLILFHLLCWEVDAAVEVIPNLVLCKLVGIAGLQICIVLGGAVIPASASLQVKQFIPSLVLITIVSYKMYFN